MLIGVSSCVEILDAPHHSVFDKYLDYVVKGMGGEPLIIPCMGKRYRDDVERISVLSNVVKRLDGVLLTGSPTNVDPTKYGEANIVLKQNGEVDADRIDLDRDSTNLPLVLACIKEGVPILGICRGMQEINVALGGTLFQELPNKNQVENHRVHQTGVFEEKYLESHDLILQEGGLLANGIDELMVGTVSLSVNSLHRQAVDKLGSGLRIEAVSEDGIVEAVSLDPEQGDLIAVQWHPEWNYEQNKANKLVLNIFRDMCVKRTNVQVQ